MSRILRTYVVYRGDIIYELYGMLHDVTPTLGSVPEKQYGQVSSYMTMEPNKHRHYLVINEETYSVDKVYDKIEEYSITRYIEVFITKDKFKYEK